MNIALILSGGTGTRIHSDIPKQYIEVCGKSIISYSLERLSLHHNIYAIQIVADSAWREQIVTWLSTADPGKKFMGFSSPGENRQLSILNGLKDIKKYASDRDYIFIHDAARPMLSDRQIDDCLKAAIGHDGVMPVLPMKDTIYFSQDGKSIQMLLNRDELYAGQAPEVFQLGSYYEANDCLLPDRILEIKGSTEPAVLAGLDICLIPGDENNFKITTEQDLERFIGIIT